MGAPWGELRVGPCGALSRRSQSSWRSGLRERTDPSLYRGSPRIEQEDFPKKKKTLGDTLGNSPIATATVSSPPGHLPIPAVCTLTRECAHPPPPTLCAPTWESPHLISEGTETTGTNQGVCAPTWECLNLISEETEITDTKERANQERLHP